MSERQELVVNGVHFKWEVLDRDGAVVRVSNPEYGTAERRIEIAVAPEDLARHMATELVRSSREQ